MVRRLDQPASDPVGQRVGDYENHKYGTNDDDALNYTINTQDMNTIEWLAPTKVLAIGTANGEFTLSAPRSATR